jgi:hypothetical protein
MKTSGRELVLVLFVFIGGAVAFGKNEKTKISKQTQHRRITEPRRAHRRREKGIFTIQTQTAAENITQPRAGSHRM